jgi:hypothetical protein
MPLQPPTKTKRGTPKGVSGNPKGPPKGTKSRRRIGQEFDLQRGAALKKASITPLAFMMEVLEAKGDDAQKYSKADRMWAAQAAAPYMHKKMPIAIEGGDRPIPIIDADKIAKMSEKDLQAMITGLALLGISDEVKDE